jgi:hypothetical protein
MKVVYFDFGGELRLTFLLSFESSDCVCTSYWETNKSHVDQKIMWPIDYSKFTSSFYLYMVTILKKIHNDMLGSLLKNHIESISGYVRLMTGLGYDKFEANLKLNFLELLVKGIQMWKIFIQSLIVTSEEEFVEIVSHITRYLMLYAVVHRDLQPTFFLE